MRGLKSAGIFLKQSILVVWTCFIERFFSKNTPIYRYFLFPAKEIYVKTKDKIQSYFRVYFENISWMGQLIEASKSGGRKSTLIATCFINILSLAFSLTIMQVYDRIIPNRSFDTMFLLFSGVFIALILEMILRMLRSYTNLWSDARYEYELSRDAFGRLIHISLHEYEQMGAGERLHQMSVLDQMKGFYNNQLLTTIYDIPFIAIFLFFIAYLGSFLVLVPLIMIVGLVYCTSLFFEAWNKILKKKFTQEAHENNLIIETVNNIHTVKSMGMESLLMRRYERLQTTGIESNYAANVQSSDLVTIKLIANQLVMVLTIAIGSLYVINGTMTLGGLAACALLVGRIIQPLNRGLGVLNRWQTVNIVREQLNSIWGLRNQKRLVLPSFGEIKGELELKNVCFRYQNDSKWILNHINLAIPLKTIISIVGAEQSGKTTLLNILATILEPTSGQYLIDGRDVSEYQLKDLRHQIAYLSQGGDLFRGTIMENLSAFDENNVPTAHRISQLLGLSEMIAKLPNGYDTVVGDRAVESLSVGMIRAIVIARALVRKPKVVLFDETNMNLDMQSDIRLRNVLLSLSKIATIVIVSHRPSIVKLASVHYELKDGKLIQVIYGK